MYLNHNNGNLVSRRYFEKYFVAINNFLLVLLVLPATGNRLRRPNHKDTLTISQEGSKTHFYQVLSVISLIPVPRKFELFTSSRPTDP